MKKYCFIFCLFSFFPFSPTLYKKISAGSVQKIEAELKPLKNNSNKKLLKK